MLSTWQFTVEALSPVEISTSTLSSFPSNQPCPFFMFPLHVAPYLLLQYFLQLLALCTCTLAPLPVKTTTEGKTAILHRCKAYIQVKSTS